MSSTQEFLNKISIEVFEKIHKYDYIYLNVSMLVHLNTYYRNIYYYRISLKTFFVIVESV